MQLSTQIRAYVVEENHWVADGSYAACFQHSQEKNNQPANQQPRNPAHTPKPNQNSALRNPKLVTKLL